ncbi:MAG TPA: alpha/beta fold hydrolase [Ilumatobacteraceae bacterium]
MTVGVLCVHGLGGTPHSVLPLTAAVHEAGYPVIALMLPGHGSAPVDLLDHTWIDWRDAVAGAVDSLAARADVNGVVVVGQSLGATIALAVAATNPHVRGVAAINALVHEADPDATEFLEHLISRGRVMQPAGDVDLRDPHAHDSAYAEVPLRSLLELGAAATAVNALLASITVPVLVVSSDLDRVVDPDNSETLAAGVRGPVTRLYLANSGHVAALDLDRELLCHELLTWLATLTDESAASA